MEVTTLKYPIRFTATFQLWVQSRKRNFLRPVKFRLEKFQSCQIYNQAWTFYQTNLGAQFLYSRSEENFECKKLIWRYYFVG